MSVSTTGSLNHSLIVFYSNSCAIFQLRRPKLQGLIHPIHSTSTANSRTCRHDIEGQLNISWLDQTVGQQERRTISSQSSCLTCGFAGYYRDMANYGNQLTVARFCPTWILPLIGEMFDQRPVQEASF